MCVSIGLSLKICVLHKSNYAFIRAESPRDVWTVNCVHTKQRAARRVASPFAPFVGWVPRGRELIHSTAAPDAMWIMFMYSPASPAHYTLDRLLELGEARDA